MSDHICRHGGVKRIPKAKCVLCMRAERNNLLAACEAAREMIETCEGQAPVTKMMLDVAIAKTKEIERKEIA